MNSNTPFLTVAENWPQLEPAVPRPPSIELHGKLAPSKTYPVGQALGYDTNLNRWDKPGATVNVGPRRRLLRYPCVTDASGNATIGDAAAAALADAVKLETVPMYTGGAFYLKDMTDVPDAAAIAELGDVIQGEGVGDTATIIVLHGS